MHIYLSSTPNARRTKIIEKQIDMRYLSKRLTDYEDDEVVRDLSTNNNLLEEVNPNVPLESEKIIDIQYLMNEPKEVDDSIVAIIGMNGIFPQSENLDEFWEKLENGSSLITEIPNDRFDWHDYNDSHMKWGAFLNHLLINFRIFIINI